METFIIFQANKNNVCAGIKFWILFHNAAWLSVPEHPAVHSVLRVDTVRAGGKTTSDRRESGKVSKRR